MGLGLNLNILNGRGLAHEIGEDFFGCGSFEGGVLDAFAAGLEPEFVGVVVLAGEAGFHEAEFIEGVFGGEEDHASEEVGVFAGGEARAGLGFEDFGFEAVDALAFDVAEVHGFDLFELEEGVGGVLVEVVFEEVEAFFGVLAEGGETGERGEEAGFYGGSLGTVVGVEEGGGFGSVDAGLFGLAVGAMHVKTP